uniref:Uncharacterized protein n=1 Tax=Aureoumbra lagunensis TaxID=44058 RepID=A0A7S3JYD8_9STRA
MCTRKEFKRALSTALKLAAERRAAISVISVLDAKLLILNRASLDHQLPSWVTKHQDHYDIVASMTRPVLNEEKNSLLPHPVIVDTEKQDGTKYKVNSIQAAQASPTCKENMRPRVKEFLQGEFQGERDENTQAWIQAMLETGIDDNTICLVLRNRFSSQTIDIKPEPKSPPTINKVEIESTSQPINAYPPDANNRKRQKSCILERIPSETASSVL